MPTNSSSNALYTKNMFLESCYELKLDLAEDLTTKRIENAYLIFEKEYQNCLNKQVSPHFELSVKAQARDYLLKTIQSK